VLGLGIGPQSHTDIEVTPFNRIFVNLGPKQRGNKMLEVGLLGAGRVVRVHAIASNPSSTLVAISGINAKAILNEPAIDAILIATSTDTHPDLIGRVTGAGKAVLC
jgi:hypothetical protein